jgi:PEP-CTERM motif
MPLLKPAIFMLLALACLMTFASNVMAGPIIAPNVLVFTELSGTQLNVAWSAGTPSPLSTSPIATQQLSPDLWRVGLATFLLRTTNTTCPGVVNCVVPLGWVEPDNSSLFNIVTFSSNPCVVSGIPFGTCIDVFSDASFSNFQFAPLLDGQTFDNAARRDANSDSPTLGFAFVDAGETAVPEPSSIGLIAIGLAGIGFRLRRSISHSH